MRFRLRGCCKVLVVWIAIITAAQAQSDHVAHYKAYSEALEQGDLAAADEHAEQAWRAAEGTLGDHQTTAILAYNFANLVYYSRPGSAREPLTRVIELTGENSDLFGNESPGLMLLFVDAVEDKESRPKEKALRKALSDLEEQNPPPNLLAARGWLHVATREMLRSRYERSEKSADFSIRHYTPFKGPGESEVANAYIVGGITRVAGSSRNTTDLREAVSLFDQAIEMFPPQRSIDTFDSQLAIALAWQAAADAAAHSDTSSKFHSGSRLNRRPPELDINARVRWENGPPESQACVMEWEERKPPKFPDSASEEGYLGAVVIGYNLEAGKVHGARILAEVPAASEFGEVSLASMDEWRASKEPPVECQSNALTTFKFVLAR